ITECGVVDAVDEGHALTQAELDDEPDGGAAEFWFADDGEVDGVSLLGQTCERAYEDGHALEGADGADGADDAAGHTFRGGEWVEVAGVHAQGGDDHALGVDTEFLGDVVGGGLGGDEDRVEFAGDPGLHSHEPVPAALGESL